jgi:hypothetical protein
MYITMYLFLVLSSCNEQRPVHEVWVKSMLKVSKSQFL